MLVASSQVETLEFLRELAFNRNLGDIKITEKLQIAYASNKIGKNNH